ncbi:rhodanese-like domain-containing protein [Humisphaera borealis]|uniref:Sulfurtransferase n=1 Tax=Humisphaera borealis TaxID=2807512 RepID=A0A7M2WTS2_9BACT|nr:rhodanese-like domain-containing protein [Humisphaera borealis]QOV88886.1 sulfurtransferase [Humisphaera borealis]
MAKHTPQFLAIVNDAKSRVKECTIDDIKARLARGEKFLLVDVREDGEWANGHLPGAVHIGKGVIERDIEVKVPDTGTEMVLYCGGGFRSALAADNLQKMGYTNVISMDGGFRGWTEAGLPVEK